MTEKIPYIEGNKTFVATRNACKVCSPLGASVALKGVKGCVPLIHGSQGCATYIRRYLISHYKEPVDIASSNFSEESTIFGGGNNLSIALQNVISQYTPEVVGIATTCLSETIGDDVPMHVRDFIEKKSIEVMPEIVHVSTPSYQGSHMDGFHEAVAALVKKFAVEGVQRLAVNLFPGFVSCEDIREMKEVLEAFEIPFTLLSDYSESLDNPIWNTYKRIPEGGTTVDEIRLSGTAKASIEFGTILNKGSLSGRVKIKQLNASAGGYLEEKFDVKNYQMPMPIGINGSDRLFDALAEITGNPIPEKYAKQRGRLVDAYVDGHKYVFGKRAIVYGEEDFVVGMCSFLDEIGMETVLAASGGDSGTLESEIKAYCPVSGGSAMVLGDLDYEKINDLAHELKPDIIIGNSKGYYIARELNIPFLRVGFPIHDRIGGQRICHLSYRGTQELFDKVTNLMIEYKQDNSPVGYKYM